MTVTPVRRNVHGRIALAVTVTGVMLAYGTSLASPQDEGKGKKAPAPPAGAAAFEEADLRRWLSYLASDELQGRQVYTEGIGLAGAYIARNLEQFGVAPAGDRGTYFQTVRVLGVRTRSRSTVTVTVNGQSRTFQDGSGVTFARNQGGRQTVSGRAEFVGHGVRFAPLTHDDYTDRSVAGSVVLYVGTKGPSGFTAAQNRLLNARGRTAIETFGAAAAIGPGPAAATNVSANAATPSANPPASSATAAPAPRATPAAPGPPARPAQPQADFQTSQRLDGMVPPQLTASDELFEFVFGASGESYADIKAKADKQEALPRIRLGDVTISISIDADYDVVQTRLTRNVVGMVRGTDRSLADTYVMLGAHYDHIGYRQFSEPASTAPDPLIAGCAGQGRPSIREGDIINNGADDDGSGSTGLMAIARAFATAGRPRRSVVFVWHSAEEGGLLGSRFMADHPVVPLDRVAAQLNIDMIGRNRCDDPKEADTVYLVGSDRISTELHNLNEEANASLRKPLTLNYEMNDVADLESLYTRSDHYSYASKGVPVIFFTTGLHRDYHYVTDEVDKILFNKVGRVAQLAYSTAWQLANLEHLPARDRRGPRMGKGRTGKL
jgi:hypothetical protein